MDIRKVPDKVMGHMKKISLKQLLILLLVILVILGSGGSYYFYQKYNAIKTNPNLEAQKETEALVLTISKLMELPDGETPTVATVLDKDKLKDQLFFKTTENGDILLAYTAAMKAILYRPSTNKIINVGPISINQPQNLIQGTTPGTSGN